MKNTEGNKYNKYVLREVDAKKRNMLKIKMILRESTNT